MFTYWIHVCQMTFTFWFLLVIFLSGSAVFLVGFSDIQKEIKMLLFIIGIYSSFWLNWIIWFCFYVHQKKGVLFARTFFSQFSFFFLNALNCISIRPLFFVALTLSFRSAAIRNSNYTRKYTYFSSHLYPLYSNEGDNKKKEKEMSSLTLKATFRASE